MMLRTVALAALLCLTPLARAADAPPTSRPTTRPVTRPDAVSVLRFDGYEITFDTTETPDLTDWVNAELKPVCQKWYPIIVGMLPSDGYAAPQKFSITFHANTGGVAYARGTEIHGSARWYRTQLKNEALGSIVHEMVHVVQQYRTRRDGPRNPGWLVEGVADYVRWHKYEPVEKRRRLNPARIKYTDSYHVTGAFLDWATQKHDKDLVVKLNAAMRQGRYSPDLWKEATGKSIDDLWVDYVVSLGGTRPPPATRPTTRPAGR
jgi:hypothetical protein